MRKNERHIYSASERQGSDKYPGIDSYETTVLKEGTRICALVAYYDNGRMKPCEFYFPQSALAQTGHNAKKLSQGLQICPWKHPQTGDYCYRTRVATFIVQADIEVEFSPKASENTSYGKGGIIQYHIPKETADLYLLKEQDDTFLPDGKISEEEYETIMEKHQQLLVKRNLFSYLKAKADTLDILQNTTDPQEEKSAAKNIEILNQHIDNLIIDLAYSQENIGDVISEKYDNLIAQLAGEIECREQEETLLVSNVKANKEIESLTQSLNEQMEVILIPSQDDAEHTAENISRKIVTYEKSVSTGARPEIDVPKQGFDDFLQVSRIISRRKELGDGAPLRERDLTRISTFVMQQNDGRQTRINLNDLFTPDSVEAIRQTRNGTFSAKLEFKEGGPAAKLLIRGNKSQFYMAQTDEQLSKTLDRIHLSPPQKEKLLNGGEIRLPSGAFHLDKELNCLVPCLSPQTESAHPIKKNGNKQDGLTRPHRIP